MFKWLTGKTGACNFMKGTILKISNLALATASRPRGLCVCLERTILVIMELLPSYLTRYVLVVI